MAKPFSSLAVFLVWFVAFDASAVTSKSPYCIARAWRGAALDRAQESTKFVTARA
jgi:hypothetical protein